jgi:hypothetical protein
MTSARARWTGLAVLAALLAVGALTLDGDELRRLLGGFTRASPPDTSRAPLTAAAPDSEGPRLEGAPRSEPTARAAADAPRGPVTLRVSDRSGRAASGVRVALDVTGAGAAAQEGVTDAAGRVFLPKDVPYDGTAAASVMPRGNQDGLFLISFHGLDPDDCLLVSGQRLGTVHVTGPEVAITIDVGLPLDVDVRDVCEGRRLNAPWQATPRLEWQEDAHDQATVPRTGGSLEIDVTAPVGWVADPSERWDLHVHPQARRLVALVPARAEVEVIAAFPPEALPVRESNWEPRVTVASRAPSVLDLSLRGDGQLGIGGVPHFMGEEVVIGGRLRGRFTTSGRGVLDESPRASLVVPIACEDLQLFTDAEIERLSTEVGRVELLLLNSLGRSSITCSSPWVYPRRIDPDPPVGAVHVRVRLPSGSPAFDARVATVHGGAVADREGRAVLGTLPAGPVEITVWGAGAVTTVRTDVTAGETAKLEVGTTLGGALDVEVVDALARPLPFAKLAVAQPSNLPWVDIDGEVQRVDPYTDVHGKRTLRMVEPGAVKVKATYGSRSAESEVTVVEGETKRLRLVLRHPEPKEASAEGAPPPAPPGVVEPVDAER